MTEEKFDALLENKEYEAAFDLVDKENTEKFKISLNSHPTSSPFLTTEIGFYELDTSVSDVSNLFHNLTFSVSKRWKRVYPLGRANWGS